MIDLCLVSWRLFLDFVDCIINESSRNRIYSKNWMNSFVIEQLDFQQRKSFSSLAISSVFDNSTIPTEVLLQSKNSTKLFSEKTVRLGFRSLFIFTLVNEPTLDKWKRWSFINVKFVARIATTNDYSSETNFTDKPRSTTSFSSNS